MFSVDELVGELLLRHNCVIVPSFGGFIAKKKSATIDYATGVISPPSKSLLFNRQLINSDGLLVADLAYRNKISFEEATALVDKQVSDWNQTLNGGARVVIDKVGFLFLDSEKNICFEQDRFFNLLLESYGLGKVVFLAEEDVTYAQQTVIQQQISKEKSAPVILLNNEPSSKIETKFEKELEPKIIAHPESKKRSAAWKYIAAACFLPIAFYSVWIPVKTDFLASGVLRLDHFNPFAKENKTDDAEATIKIDKVNTSASQEVEAPQIEQETDTNNEEPVKSTLIEPLEDNISVPQSKVAVKSFDYIVGSFADPINAKLKIEELKALGMNAFIKETFGGMTRVSIGTTSNAKDIERLANQASKHGIKGWILKK